MMIQNKEFDYNFKFYRFTQKKLGRITEFYPILYIIYHIHSIEKNEYLEFLVSHLTLPN